MIQKLKEFSYYKDKLPIILKNSYGFVEQYEIFDKIGNGSSPRITNNMSGLNIRENLNKVYLYEGETTSEFTKNKYYKVIEGARLSYYANGGQGALPGSQDYELNTTVSVNFTDLPTYSGHRYLGWDTNQSATTPTYTSTGTTSFSITQDTDLYAIWKEVYTVTYNLKDGTSDIPVIDSNIYDSGSQVIVYTNGSYFNIQKADTATTYFNFIGWSTDPNATSPMYYDIYHNSFIITSNVTLYAVYEELQKASITFNINGGTGVIRNPIYAKPNTELVNLEVGDPGYTKGNDVFVGYDTDSESSVATYLKNNTYSFTISQNITLYAIYNAVPVSFATDSWDVIQNEAKRIAGGGTSSPYQIGDTKLIDDNTEIRIIGMNHDNVANSSEYGSTKAGLSMMLTHCYGDTSYTKRMNNYTSTVYTYSSSLMPSTLSSIKNSLPSELKNIIVNVVKYSYTTASSGNRSVENLYLLSYMEIFGTRLEAWSTTAIGDEPDTYQYEWFANAPIPEGKTPVISGTTAGSYFTDSAAAGGVVVNSRMSLPEIKESSSYGNYWLRSGAISSSYVRIIYGETNAQDSENRYYRVAFGFCI